MTIYCISRDHHHGFDQSTELSEICQCVFVAEAEAITQSMPAMCRKEQEWALSQRSQVHAIGEELVETKAVAGWLKPGSHRMPGGDTTVSV